MSVLTGGVQGHGIVGCPLSLAPKTSGSAFPLHLGEATDVPPTPRLFDLQAMFCPVWFMSKGASTESHTKHPYKQEVRGTRSPDSWR